jgi:hypothetical protein
MKKQEFVLQFILKRLPLSQDPFGCNLNGAIEDAIKLYDTVENACKGENDKLVVATEVTNGRRVDER